VGSMNAPFKAPQSAATFRADWTYADWMALGMQEADRDIPHGHACRKADYAVSYVRTFAPVPLIRAHDAVRKAERDAEYGAAPFKLTTFGLEKL
jgi:hypothetical protein